MKVKKVEERFSNGKCRKKVRTVGELIDELSRLPRGVKLTGGFRGGVDVVLFNASGDFSGPCVGLEDHEE